MSPLHRRDVDGLRGLAVLLVVLFHAFPALVPGGFVGVDVFFVISGFVVSAMLRRQLEGGTFSARDFVRRRINRLAPALLLVLAATLALGVVFLSPTLLSLMAGHALAGLLLAANVLHAAQSSSYFDASSSAKPLLHLWSLSVEEQFYLAVLLVLLARRLFPKPRAWLWLATVASFTVSVVMTRAQPGAAYYLPMSRAWELLVGLLLGSRAVPEAVPRAGWMAGLGLMGVLLPAFLFRESWPFPGALALLPVGGTALLVLSGPGTAVGAWASRRLLVGLGLISYPLYLWHWPVLVLLRLATPTAQHGVAGVVGLAVSGLLAWLTFRWLEVPVRRAQRSSTAVACVGLSLVLAGLAWSMTRAPERWSRRGPLAAKVTAFEKGYDYQTDGRLHDCWLLDDAVGLFDEGCIESKPANTPLVLVWGDSHAARLTAGLRAVQAERPTFRIGQRTRSSCLPLPNVGVRACQVSYDAVHAEVLALRPEVLVLTGRWRSLGDASVLAKQLVALRKELPDTTVQVVGPLPEWRVSLPWVLSMRSGGVTLPSRLVPEGLETQRVLDVELRALVEATGARYESAMEALCEPLEGCLVTMSEEPLMLSSWDYSHLTTPAARVVARRLAMRW